MDAVEPAPDVLFQEIEGELVLLDLGQERYFSLDDVGTRFWQLLTEHGEVDVVITAMLAEFDVDEPTLRHDVGRLLGELRERGLVVPRGTAA